jgi:hypothetical protein
MRPALPDALYKGITFTMPNVLWTVFRDNPRLAKALPVLAAKVIQARASAKYGLRVGVIAILHTFNRVQLTCTHNGYRGRAVRVLRHLDFSRLL